MHAREQLLGVTPRHAWELSSKGTDGHGQGHTAEHEHISAASSHVLSHPLEVERAGKGELAHFLNSWGGNRTGVVSGHTSHIARLRAVYSDGSACGCPLCDCISEGKKKRKKTLEIIPEWATKPHPH